MDEKDQRIEQLHQELEGSILKIKLLEKEIADSKNVRLTIFSNLSHEVRNPINGIMGFSELLNTTEVSKEEQKLYSSAIDESSGMLLSILSDVFDIARLEAHRFNAYPVSFDLNDLMYDLYAEYKGKAEIKQLHLFLDNLISEPYIISTDPDILKRILKKLLDNAIKFTKTGWVKLKYEVGDTSISFVVEDSGIGIAEPLWSNLFNRFITEEVSKSRNIGGTGLDLSLCNGLVRLLGGKIWYEPKGQDGSIFHFTILDRKKEL